MAALSQPVVTRGGATLFCLKMLLLELLFLPARPAAALPGGSRHSHKTLTSPLRRNVASVLLLKNKR